MLPTGFGVRKERVLAPGFNNRKEWMLATGMYLYQRKEWMFAITWKQSSERTEYFGSSTIWDCLELISHPEMPIFNGEIYELRVPRLSRVDFNNLFARNAWQDILGTVTAPLAWDGQAKQMETQRSRCSIQGQVVCLAKCSPFRVSIRSDLWDIPTLCMPLHFRI